MNYVKKIISSWINEGTWVFSSNFLTFLAMIINRCKQPIFNYAFLITFTIFTGTLLFIDAHHASTKLFLSMAIWTFFIDNVCIIALVRSTVGLKNFTYLYQNAAKIICIGTILAIPTFVPLQHMLKITTPSLGFMSLFITLSTLATFCILLALDTSYSQTFHIIKTTKISVHMFFLNLPSILLCCSLLTGILYALQWIAVSKIILLCLLSAYVTLYNICISTLYIRLLYKGIDTYYETPYQN